MGGVERGEIAEGEAGVGVWAAHGAQCEGGFVGQDVGAEAFCAGELGGAVDLGEAGADGLVGLRGWWGWRRRGWPR